MGLVAKLEEIRDAAVLRGTLRNDPGGIASYVASDGDWNIFVIPDPEYRYLLTNPSGFTNTTGMVPCEVEPVNILPGGRDPADEAVLDHFVDLPGCKVKIVGTWTRDRAHAFDGSSLVVDVPEAGVHAFDGNRGQTEIHPITSLLGKSRSPKSGVRRFIFLVFCDASLGMPATPGHPFSSIVPPHAHENRRGTFKIAVAPDAKVTKVREDAQLAGSPLHITSGIEQGVTYIKGSVESGVPDHLGLGKGFYHLVFEVPALFSLRAFFASPWDEKPLHPCQEIQRQLHRLEAGTKQVGKTKVPVEDGEIEAMRAKLEDCWKRHPQQPLSLRAKLASRTTVKVPGGISVRALIEDCYP